MMGVINLSAVLEYGRASSVIRRMGGFGGVKDRTNISHASVRVVVKRATTITKGEETKMDDDDALDLKLIRTIQAFPVTSKVDKAVPAMTNKYHYSS
jgi:hypothetical protein